MVLFDLAFCTVATCTLDSWFWTLFSSLVDCLVVTFIIILLMGLEWKIPLGLLINFGINAALKALIQDPRPLAGCGCGYGMPSGDVQTIALLATIFLWRNSSWYWWWHLIVAVACTGLVVAARVLTGFHTLPQVLVAIPIGIVVGGLYSAVLYWLEPRKHKHRV
jgi:hypothetical protein